MIDLGNVVKLFYIEIFSICYSFFKQKQPHYPLLNSTLVFSAIIALVLTFLLMFTGVFLQLHIVNVLKYSILLCWIIFIVWNYFYFSNLLESKKLKVLPFARVKLKYYIIVSFGFVVLVGIVALAQISFLQNN